MLPHSSFRHARSRSPSTAIARGSMSRRRSTSRFPRSWRSPAANCARRPDFCRSMPGSRASRLAAPILPGGNSTYTTGRTTRGSGCAASVSQSLDLLRESRWQPSVGGGLELQRVSDHYEQRTVRYFDESVSSVFPDDRQQTLVAALATGGIRVALARRVFVMASGIFRYDLRGT